MSRQAQNRAYAAIMQELRDPYEYDAFAVIRAKLRQVLTENELREVARFAARTLENAPGVKLVATKEKN